MKMRSKRSHSFGKGIERNIYVVPVEIDADASSGLTIKSPISGTVVGMRVLCKATSAGGTVGLSNDTNPITDDVAMAANHALAEAATVDDAENEIGKGEDLVLTANGAADRGLVMIEILPA